MNKYLGQGTIIHIDDRGYALVRYPDDTYSAGCRGDYGREPWTREQCIEHWSSPDYPNPERAAGFLAAVERCEPVTVVSDELRVLWADGADLRGVRLPGELDELRANCADLRDVAMPPSLSGLWADGANLRGVRLPRWLAFLRADGADLDGIALPGGLRMFWAHRASMRGVAIPAACNVFGQPRAA